MVRAWFLKSLTNKRIKTRKKSCKNWLFITNLMGYGCYEVPLAIRFGNNSRSWRPHLWFSVYHLSDGSFDPMANGGPWVGNSRLQAIGFLKSRDKVLTSYRGFRAVKTLKNQKVKNSIYVFEKLGLCNNNSLSRRSVSSKNLKKNLTWPASSISLMKNSSAPPINHLNSITILMILITICDHFAVCDEEPRARKIENDASPRGDGTDIE